MDQRGTRSNRVLEIHHCLEGLVHDLDKLAGCLSDVNVDRRDGRDGVTLVEDLVARKDVVTHVLEIAATLAKVNLAILGGREVGGRNHCVDTIEGTCLRGVDADDSRMGVRTAQDLPEQEAIQPGVPAVRRTSGHLVHTVVTDRAGTDYVVVAMGNDDVGAIISRDDAGRCIFTGGTIDCRRHSPVPLSIAPSLRIVARVWGKRSRLNRSGLVPNPHDVRGMHHGPNDLVVAGASAQIARKPEPNLILGRVRIVLEQFRR